MRLRKAWKFHEYSDDDFHHGIIHASSRDRARTLIARQMDWSGAFTYAMAMRIVRAPNEDILLPHRHPIVDSLTEKERHCIYHAFGGDRGGWRSYYYTDAGDPVICRLVYKHGLMVLGPYGNDTNSRYFYLSEIGMMVAQSMMPTYPDEIRMRRKWKPMTTAPQTGRVIMLQDRENGDQLGFWQTNCPLTGANSYWQSLEEHPRRGPIELAPTAWKQPEPAQ